MAIEMKVTRNLGNNSVQVDLNTPKVPTRYFKVNKDNVDQFCKEYKKFYKEERIWSSIKLATPAVLVCGITNAFCKKLNKFTRMGASIAAGVIALMSTTGFVTKSIIKNENKILDKYQIEELNYDNKKLPI